MARQPRQVHVYLYRRNGNTYEYAIFRRTDMPFCWQGVSGGVEDDETLEEAVYREVTEETGITEHLPIVKLESISYLPDTVFNTKDRARWGNKLVVVPMYFFGILYDGKITLSHEHTEMKWLAFDDAYRMIYYSDQQIALYELHEKLQRQIIR